MIAEGELRARAEYMGLVHRQLKALRSRKDLDPFEYPALLDVSTLRLGEIEWVREMVAESAKAGKVGPALDRLIMYYEGYYEALARVLESKPDELFASFDQEKARRIESEMFQAVTRRERRPT